jgi:hypothetical protein
LEISWNVAVSLVERVCVWVEVYRKPRTARRDIEGRERMIELIFCVCVCVGGGGGVLCVVEVFCRIGLD